jgi:DNA-binding response OmpR family regulator
MSNAVALIIEDDTKLADIFAQALQAAGFETEVIGDGREARNRLAEVTPAVVVLDLHLPYFSGEQILREIRVEPRFEETRVMIATADPILAEALRPDADLVLIKPISFSQLRDLAKRLRLPGPA